MFDFLDGPVRELVVAVYGAIGYVGVALIVALESVVIPIPSELVLPFAGFLVAAPLAIEPTRQIRPLTRSARRASRCFFAAFTSPRR